MDRQPLPERLRRGDTQTVLANHNACIMHAAGSWCYLHTHSHHVELGQKCNKSYEYQNL